MCTFIAGITIDPTAIVAKPGCCRQPKCLHPSPAKARNDTKALPIPVKPTCAVANLPGTHPGKATKLTLRQGGTNKNKQDLPQGPPQTADSEMTRTGKPSPKTHARCSYNVQNSTEPTPEI